MVISWLPTAATRDRPGLSGDPAAGITDMQWFMLRQQNIACYAAFSTRRFDRSSLVDLARRLVAAAPQLGWICGSIAPIDDATVARLVSIEPVDSFAGFPEVWLNRPSNATADPKLPMFRLRVAQRRAGPDTDGPSAFLLVQVSHALVEGADSALLSRSRSASHPVSVSARPTRPRVAMAAHSFGTAAAFLHLLIANLVTLRPGPFGFETRVYPRARFSRMARQFRVRQRALYFALVMHALFSAGTPEGKRRISCTYSTIDNGGGDNRDTYMRMRMLFSVFHNAPDFPTFAKAVDRQLAIAEARESGFNAELNAAGISFHRRLSRVLPGAYTSKVFGFMPYDIVIGLIPPHRLGGALTEGLVEPVYAGAATPGANGCVVVPGRELVSFNFYVEQKLLDAVRTLDVLLSSTFSEGINSLDETVLNGANQGDNVANWSTGRTVS
jgi:hypothetical protein